MDPMAKEKNNTNSEMPLMAVQLMRYWQDRSGRWGQDRCGGFLPNHRPSTTTRETVLASLCPRLGAGFTLHFRLSQRDAGNWEYIAGPKRFGYSTSNMYVAHL